MIAGYRTEAEKQGLVASSRPEAGLGLGHEVFDADGVDPGCHNEVRLRKATWKATA